ncbi:hypothetical protein BH18ACT2_BH18ACT2_05810 [soil metagenome]
MTDAAPLGRLVERRDRRRGHHRFRNSAFRDVRQLVGVAVRVAALTDIIASEELAGVPKDLEALPELCELRRRAAQGDVASSER